MNVDPYARQKLLPEVGDAGQRRLQEAVIRVPDGPGARYGAEYLSRAGVSEVRIDPEAPPCSFPHEAHFRHRESGELGSGAWQALNALRCLLGS